MTYQQLDLFEIADENERLSNLTTKSWDDIKFGDILHVKWSNGVEWEGPYTGLTGFWDGRNDADYKWFVPRQDSWFYVGHDDTFQLPDKESVLPAMIQRLRPFKELSQMLGVYRSFENEYPRHAEGWCHIGFMSEQWNKAVCELVSLDDVLAQQKYWQLQAKLPKEVEAYIRDVVFPIVGPERIRALSLVRWSEVAWIDTRGTKNYRVHSFPDEKRHGTCWGGLLAKCIRECRTPDELVTVAKLWGSNTDIVDKQVKKFWIQD